MQFYQDYKLLNYAKLELFM